MGTHGSPRTFGPPGYIRGAFRALVTLWLGKGARCILHDARCRSKDVTRSILSCADEEARTHLENEGYCVIGAVLSPVECAHVSRIVPAAALRRKQRSICTPRSWNNAHT